MRSRSAFIAETATVVPIPWWLVMIIGSSAFILGVLLLISPGMTLLVLVQFMGAYFLVTGVLSLVSLFIDGTLWGWKLISSVLGILAGLVVLRDPLWSAIFVPAVLVIFLALESLIIGVTQVIHAFTGGASNLALLGILNIIFGIILLFNPLIGVHALPIILGIFAVIGGIFVSIRAFVSRHQETIVQSPEAQHA